MYESEKIFLGLKNCTVTIARLFYPFGFDEFTKPDNFISRLFQKTHTGQEIFIPENAGKFIFKPIFIQDFISIIQKLLQHPFHGILNIAGDEAVTLPAVLKKISTITSVPVKIKKEKNIPAPFDADTSLLHELFPAFSMTPLDEALKIAFANLQKTRMLQ
jgi:nucleoside-diphosphate-sugar epimerase